MPLGLSPYMWLSARAEGYARRRLARRATEGKEDAARIEERFGHASRERPKGRLVWFHAASVGESLSILELIRRLGESERDLHFLITTGTISSARLLEARIPSRSIHQFVPVDVLPAVRRFLDHWRPDLAIWTESELWPALILETHRRGVPLLLINGRMSRKSFDRWRWFRGASRKLMRSFAMVLAQDAQSAARFAKLGAADGRVETTGSLKEGSAPLGHNEAERQRMTRQLDGRPVWLAASTHPGEEEIVAKAHGLVRRSSPGMLLILVPRHPERGQRIDEDLTVAGWVTARRSAGASFDRRTEIYIADTLGELGLWYRISPVSFVGGSLVDIGGHNPFEPASLGSAILHGPHVSNFAEIYERLGKANAAIEVRDAPGLAQAVGKAIQPECAAKMAAAAWEMTSEGAEVTDRVMEVIIRHLPRETAA